MGKLYISKQTYMRWMIHLLNYSILSTSIFVVFLLSYVYVWVQEDTEIAETLEEIQKEVEGKVQLDIQGSYPVLDIDFSEYTKSNTDVKAWLSVPAIDMSIPITQGVDNDYYLTHDLYKKPNKLGWVFVDARSNLLEKEQNTVIYGHNTTAGHMFGGLKDFLSLNILDEGNRYIQLNTEKEQRVYEVFSVYVTHETDWTYIQSNLTDAEYKEFLQDKNNKNENPHLTTGIEGVSEILTFSTCYGPIGTDKRLVIHAKIVTKQSR